VQDDVTVYLRFLLRLRYSSLRNVIYLVGGLRRVSLHLVLYISVLGRRPPCSLFCIYGVFCLNIAPN
jgi:hypothetical protein